MGYGVEVGILKHKAKFITSLFSHLILMPFIQCSSEQLRVPNADVHFPVCWGPLQLACEASCGEGSCEGGSSLGSLQLLVSVLGLQQQSSSIRALRSASSQMCPSLGSRHACTLVCGHPPCAPHIFPLLPAGSTAKTSPYGADRCAHYSVTLVMRLENGHSSPILSFTASLLSSTGFVPFPLSLVITRFTVLPGLLY